MQIKTVKATMKFFHRSWHKWWEVIFYYKLISATSVPNARLLDLMHETYSITFGVLSNMLLVVPLEAQCRFIKWQVLGEGNTYVPRLNLADWAGFRIAPFQSWVTSDAQARITWHRPNVRSTWYTDIPYTWDFDWTDGAMDAPLFTALEIVAGQLLIPWDIGDNTTAFFARHAQGLGYVPVSSYEVYRHVVSNNTRRWSY